MGFSTFSGPLRAGTVRQGAGDNVGDALLTQFYSVPFSAMTTAPSAVTLFTLPAGSRIMDFGMDITTAISGGGVTNVGVVFGKSGTANAYMTSINSGLTATRVAKATIDAALQVAATDNIGTSDVPVTGTFTAAGGNPTAGSMTVWVKYIQRAADGTDTPVGSA